MLQEWDKSLIKSVFPVLLGGSDDRGFLQFPFGKLGGLPTTPSIATKTKLLSICAASGIPVTEAAIRRSVKDVVGAILVNQGVKLFELGAEDVALDSCVARVFDKGSEVATSMEHSLAVS